MARPSAVSMRNCSSQVSPRAASSLISAKRSSQSASWLQVMKAKRPSCSITRSSFSAKPSSSSALISARSEATSSVLTCNREDSRAGSTASMAISLSDSAPFEQAIGRRGPAGANVALAAHTQPLHLEAGGGRIAQGDDEGVAVVAVVHVELPAGRRQRGDLGIEHIARLHDNGLKLVVIG